MTVEIKVPAMGESVTEATVSKWFKKQGESVARDEPLLELETDKVTLEVQAVVAGRLSEIRIGPGVTAKVGEVVAVHVIARPHTNVDDVIPLGRGAKAAKK